MIPEISQEKEDQLTLNTVRFAFATASGLLAFLIAAAIFRSVHDPTWQYGSLCFTVLVIGLAAGSTFVVGVPEPARVQIQSKPVCGTDWLRWFMKPLFYEVSIIFFCVRMAVTVMMVAMPFFLERSLHLTRDAKGLLPFTLQLATLVATPFFRNLLLRTGIAWGFVLGGLLGSFSSAVLFVIFLFLPITGAPLGYAVYPIAILIGAGTALSTVSVMNMQSTLVSDRIDSSAFVYGTIGACEKLFNGFVIYLLECTNMLREPNTISWVVSGLPCLAFIFGSIVSLIARSRLDTPHTLPSNEPMVEVLPTSIQPPSDHQSWQSPGVKHGGHGRPNGKPGKFTPQVSSNGRGSSKSVTLLYDLQTAENNADCRSSNSGNDGSIL